MASIGRMMVFYYLQVVVTFSIKQILMTESTSSSMVEYALLLFAVLIC